MAWQGRLHGVKNIKGSTFYKLDSDKEETDKEKISESDLNEKMSQVAERIKLKRNGRNSTRKVSNPNSRKYRSV